MNTNNNYYTPREVEIDLIELMWRMLAQWKAILVCALIMAVLVPSAVHMRDTRAYNAAQAEAEEEAANPVEAEEAIGELVAALKPEDRPAVEQAIRNDEIIAEKREYLEKSMLLNLDPQKAVTASFGYYLTCDADADELYALFKGYSAAFGDSKSQVQIMEAMGIDSEPQYMKELVWVDGVPDGDTAKIIQVNIICLDESMMDGAAEVSDKIMKNTCSALSDTLVKHSVKRIYAQSSQRTLESLSTAQLNAYGALYNLQSQQRGHIGTFNEDQKKAYEGITEIENAALNAGEALEAAAGESGSKKGGEAAAGDEEEAKPGFRKKFAAVGFVLGAFLYVMIYVVWLVLSRRIDNAGAAQTYTGARLLGEYYYPAKKGALSALLHSKAVTKHRYGKNMDFEAQADRVAEAIAASCANKDIREVTLVQLFDDAETGRNAAAGELVRAVAERLQKGDAELAAGVMPAFPGPDERELADKKHAVFFVAGDTKTAVLDSTLSLCKDYDIGKVGTVFAGSV